MYRFVLLLFFWLHAQDLRSDAIRPTRQEISRCMPETFQAKTSADLVKLEKLGKVVKLLNKAANGSFQKNCKNLAKFLKTLDLEELFDKKNLSKKISENKKSILVDIFKNSDKTWTKYLDYLNNNNKYLAKPVKALNFLFNKKHEITLVELMQQIDLIQAAVLQFLEMFQVLSALDFARQEIEGYDAILLGMQDQLFVISSRVNVIVQITKSLRGTYLNSLDKGDCSGDDIAKALGLTHKKRVAIANE